MDELKECPFCGGKAEVMEADSSELEYPVPLYVVLCTKCGGGSGASEDKQTAIDLWNKRT